MDTPETIITWATPVFFVLIGLELLVAHWRGRAAYHSADAISSIGLGVISQVVGVFSKLLTFGIYGWVAVHGALFTLPATNPVVWLAALLAYDFLYYWLHRAGHEVNILWAAHVVHHQSEHYNLSTALRQTGSGVLLGWLFYLPMAVLGIPLSVFVIVALIDLLYQFWVHTEQIGRLGWFDRVFCSPSNHRAHHAVNERYLDRNYGGILIVWDRLFGSFVEEDDTDPPVYGTRAPLRSWNPLWANVEVYWAAAGDMWHARRWGDKLRVWLKPPGWRPDDVAARFPKPVFDLQRERYAPPMSRAPPPSSRSPSAAGSACRRSIRAWAASCSRCSPAAPSPPHGLAGAGPRRRLRTPASSSEGAPRPPIHRPPRDDAATVFIRQKTRIKTYMPSNRDICTGPFSQPERVGIA